MKEIDYREKCAELVEIFEAMRRAQREFFKTKRLSDLREAKELEAQADEFFEAFKRGFLEQGSLFG